MSYNPETGLAYIPGTLGTNFTYSANPNFVPAPTDIGTTGRGVIQIGTGGAAPRGAPSTAPALAPGLDSAQPPPEPVARGAVPAQPARGRGGPQTLPAIGPQGTGNALVAWNPVSRQEKWRGPRGSSAGFNAGGTLTTAGNLVFSHVAGSLQVFRADDGTQVANLVTGPSPGPPMTYMLDGKQYVVVACAQGASAKLLAFRLDESGAPPPPPPAAPRTLQR
jgi:hypothetical protein